MPDPAPGPAGDTRHRRPQLTRGWREGPVKALERQNAAAVQALMAQAAIPRHAAHPTQPGTGRFSSACCSRRSHTDHLTSGRADAQINLI